MLAPSNRNGRSLRDGRHASAVLVKRVVGDNRNALTSVGNVDGMPLSAPELILRDDHQERFSTCLATLQDYAKAAARVCTYDVVEVVPDDAPAAIPASSCVTGGIDSKIHIAERA